jgi:L-methionine (R)-S-oxide reductase
MMDAAFIERLVGVGALIDQHQSLEEGLADLARLAAESINAGRCSVMLLSEQDATGTGRLKVCSHFGDLPAEAYSASEKPGESIAWHVVQTQEPLLLEDVQRSSFAQLARRDADMGRSMMSAPIMLAQRVVGVINVSQPVSRGCFEPSELRLLEVFALFVGRSIQVFQLQKLSESRLLQMARLLEQRDTGAPGPISPDPEKLAKIVAKGFYRELHQAGFGTNAIISVATEVLGLLEDNLQKHRSRAARHAS